MVMLSQPFVMISLSSYIEESQSHGFPFFFKVTLTCQGRGYTFPSSGLFPPYTAKYSHQII